MYNPGIKSTYPLAYPLFGLDACCLYVLNMCGGELSDEHGSTDADRTSIQSFPFGSIPLTDSNISNRMAATNVNTIFKFISANQSM